MKRAITATILIPAIERLLALLMAGLLLLSIAQSPDNLHGEALIRFAAYNVIAALLFLTTWKLCFHEVTAWTALEESFGKLVRYVFLGCSGVTAVFVGILATAGVHSYKALAAATLRFWCFSLLLVCVRLIATKLLMCFLSRKRSRVMIVGTGPLARKAWRTIRTRHYASMDVLGFLDEGEPEDTYPEIRRKYRGNVSDLEDILLREVVDILVIAMPAKSCYASIQHAIHVAERVGVDLVRFDGTFHVSSRTTLQNLNQPLRDLNLLWQYELRLFLKRIFDIFASASGLIVLSPVLGLIALCVKLTSPGPALFKQERYGWRRRRFTLLKFRTMVMNAEDMLTELERHNEADGPIFKMKNDPRVTPLGRILRKTSLDELPQLWNVLRGDMSLVGPRPMSLRDVSLFSSSYLMRRFRVKPGITGLWQISGRSNSTFDHWVRMDFQYIDHWSLWLDLKILLQTVPAVLKGSGAM